MLFTKWVSHESMGPYVPSAEVGLLHHADTAVCNEPALVMHTAPGTVSVSRFAFCSVMASALWCHAKPHKGSDAAGAPLKTWRQSRRMGWGIGGSLSIHDYIWWAKETASIARLSNQDCSATYALQHPRPDLLYDMLVTLETSHPDTSLLKTTAPLNTGD